MKLENVCIISLIILIYSCNTKSQSNISIEGKWKIVDWTYIDYDGRNLDDREKEYIAEGINDVILEFSDEHIFSSNSPEIFAALNNKKFQVLNSEQRLLFEDKDNPENSVFIDFINRDNEKIFLFHSSNMVLEIQKIKESTSISTFLDVYYQENTNTITYDDAIDIYSIYDLNKLDVVPQISYCEEVEKEYQEDCLLVNIQTSLEYFMDYSLVENTVHIHVTFLIDPTGNIKNLEVESSDTSINKDIKRAIMDLPSFKPGIKDNNPVTSRISVQMKLISN